MGRKIIALLLVLVTILSMPGESFNLYAEQIQTAEVQTEDQMMGKVQTGDQADDAQVDDEQVDDTQADENQTDDIQVAETLEDESDVENPTDADVEANSVEENSQEDVTGASTKVTKLIFGKTVSGYLKNSSQEDMYSFHTGSTDGFYDIYMVNKDGKLNLSCNWFTATNMKILVSKGKSRVYQLHKLEKNTTYTFGMGMEGTIAASCHYTIKIVKKVDDAPDSTDLAKKVSLSKNYTGNIVDDKDYDCYKFKTDKSDSVYQVKVKNTSKTDTIYFSVISDTMRMDLPLSKAELKPGASADLRVGKAGDHTNQVKKSTYYYIGVYSKNGSGSYRFQINQLKDEDGGSAKTLKLGKTYVCDLQYENDVDTFQIKTDGYLNYEVVLEYVNTGYDLYYNIENGTNGKMQSKKKGKTVVTCSLPQKKTSTITVAGWGIGGTYSLQSGDFSSRKYKITIRKAAPYGLKAATTGAKIQLNWSQVKLCDTHDTLQKNGECYEIYRATSKDGKYKKLVKLQGFWQKSYLDSSVKVGTTYYYKIRVCYTYKNKKYYGPFSAKVKQKAGELKLNQSNAQLYVGSKLKLKIPGATTTIQWSSSNKALATVDANGVVTGKKKGTVTITGTVSGVKCRCKITLKKPYLNKTKMTLTDEYAHKLTLEGTAIGSVKSSNSKVVTVSKKGYVRAKKPGTATITLIGKDKKAYRCKVTVKRPYIKNTTFSASLVEYESAKKTIHIENFTGSYSDLIWKSSSKSVATLTPYTNKKIELCIYGVGTAYFTTTVLGTKLKVKVVGKRNKGKETKWVYDSKRERHKTMFDGTVVHEIKISWDLNGDGKVTSVWGYFDKKAAKQMLVELNKEKAKYKESGRYVWYEEYYDQAMIQAAKYAMEGTAGANLEMWFGGLPDPAKQVKYLQYSLTDYDVNVAIGCFVCDGASSSPEDYLYGPYWRVNFCTFYDSW